MGNKLCNDCGNAEAVSIKRPYCRPCRNKRERNSYNPEKDKARHLKYLYGITLEDYHKILSAQLNQCAICGIGLECLKRNVDHDHKTGKIRAILCVKCNLSIGLLEDEEWIIKAMKYLKFHAKKK